MIDHAHPAVEAADRAAIRWMEDRELETDLGGTAYMLTAALPLLESATEDNLARLRGTPAGQALMAEGWESCRRSIQHDPDALDVLPNPYHP